MAGVAIVLGSAKAALAELEAAREIAPDAPIVCVNDALRACPVRAHAFATLHPEKADRFLDGLDLRRIPIITHARMPYDDRPWHIIPDLWGGSSGLYGVQVAIQNLGFHGVIAAGCPMQATARANYAPGLWGGDDDHVARYQRGWVKAGKSGLRNRVRSMSGWTRAEFGAPDAVWIAGLSRLGAVSHLRA